MYMFIRHTQMSFFSSRKFIPFPDNQDVLDLIDKPRTGILQLLDEQCMVNWGSDEKFSLNLYSNCEKHDRFSAGSAQKVRKQFSVEHYAGYVEYTIENWLEKNKDQLPAASVELLESSEFELIGQIKVKRSRFSLIEFVSSLTTHTVFDVCRNMCVQRDPRSPQSLLESSSRTR